MERAPNWRSIVPFLYYSFSDIDLYVFLQTHNMNGQIRGFIQHTTANNSPLSKPEHGALTNSAPG